MFGRSFFNFRICIHIYIVCTVCMYVFMYVRMYRSINECNKEFRQKGMTGAATVIDEPALLTYIHGTHFSATITTQTILTSIRPVRKNSACWLSDVCIYVYMYVCMYVCVISICNTLASYSYRMQYFLRWKYHFLYSFSLVILSHLCMYVQCHVKGI
jgi:hypothetical protein